MVVTDRFHCIIICPETGVGITWGLHWLPHETAHVKPLFCHSLAFITCSLHWSAHETADVEPSFCHTLALHGVYIYRLMKLPMLNHCFATHRYYVGLTLVSPWNSPCKAIILPHIGKSWVSIGHAHYHGEQYFLVILLVEYARIYSNVIKVCHWWLSGANLNDVWVNTSIFYQ